MTIAVDPADYGSSMRLPGIAVAAAASIGAGAVHAAAAGVHAEHPGLARLFIILACAQLGAGLWGLTRPRRIVALAIAVVNVVSVGGWLVTRLTGVSWIEGLEVREAPQFADSTCALLALVAAGAALAAVLVGWHPGRPQRLTLPGLAAAALTIPAMISGGTHVHSHDDGAITAEHAAEHADGDDHAHDDDPAGDPADDLGPVTEDTHGHEDDAHVDDDHAGDDHADDDHADDDHGHDDATASTDPDGATGGTTPTTDDQAHDDTTHDDTHATWPRPWDPAGPIDLAGVEGVTPEQEARAVALVEQSLVELPRWADTAVAVADGYASIGDAGTGSEHYIKLSLIQDGVILDPTQPESLVYSVQGDERILAGAMFIAPAQPTDSPELVDWAGPLMTWHNHGNLCWALDENGVAKVVGVVDDTGTCARGVNTGGENPMVHVWITPHPCGVFAALEGVGAGQAAVSEEERTDMCQEGHGHDDSTDEPAVPTVPYDPTKPIDLSGVAGVTPEQQAAAENLVAVNVVRLPQWADYRVAEAAGFHSIGDGLTGHEHYINWDWINDDVALDPDHPESLVYAPQPDGSKQLVSAMYMLPDTVALEDVPDIGGALMQWHIHDNLCFTTDPVAPRVAGLTDSGGSCPAGLQKLRPAPMIHVWITPHPCGPFAALEGVGAGQILDGEERLCDHAHGASDGLL